jgi:hypothetical protein
MLPGGCGPEGGTGTEFVGTIELPEAGSEETAVLKLVGSATAVAAKAPMMLKRLRSFIFLVGRRREARAARGER